jgi:hypothetical protein
MQVFNWLDAHPKTLGLILLFTPFSLFGALILSDPELKRYWGNPSPKRTTKKKANKTNIKDFWIGISSIVASIGLLWLLGTIPVDNDGGQALVVAWFILCFIFGVYGLYHSGFWKDGGKDANRRD